MRRRAKLVLLGAEILHVGVGSEPRVIREIPAWMVWIVVNHDVVAVPQPIANVVIIVRRDAPIKPAEGEAVTASASKAINVAGANSAAEASVFPRMVKMVVGITAAGIMTDPAIAFSMNVRSFGMAFLIAVTGAGSAASSIAVLYFG
jgi:hypothetical protein